MDDFIEGDACSMASTSMNTRAFENRCTSWS